VLPGSLCDSDEDVAEEDAVDIGVRVKARAGELFEELRFAEAILGRVFEEGAIGPAVQGRTRDLFEEESAAWLEHAGYLGDAGLPERNVVKDAEIEDSIEARIGEWQLFHGCDMEAEPVAKHRIESLACTRDLPWVEVDAFGMYCSELAEEQRQADSAAAADLQHAPALDFASEPAQEGHLIIALNPCARGIGDEPSLRCIELHASALRKMK